jgi:hypothetical protein
MRVTLVLWVARLLRVPVKIRDAFWGAPYDNSR